MNPVLILGLGPAPRLGIVGSAAAAYGAVNQIWTYIQMPAMAIGTAVNAMAAQKIGASLRHRIDRITLAGIAINLLLTGAMVLCVMLFQAAISRLINRDANVARKKAVLFRKKEPKNFCFLGARFRIETRQRHKSLLLLFFRKEGLATSNRRMAVKRFFYNCICVGSGRNSKYQSGIRR